MKLTCYLCADYRAAISRINVGQPYLCEYCRDLLKWEKEKQSNGS